MENAETEQLFGELLRSNCHQPACQLFALFAMQTAGDERAATQNNKMNKFPVGVFPKSPKPGRPEEAKQQRAPSSLKDGDGSSARSSMRSPSAREDQRYGDSVLKTKRSFRSGAEQIRLLSLAFVGQTRLRSKMWREIKPSLEAEATKELCESWYRWRSWQHCEDGAVFRKEHGHRNLSC